MINLRSINFFSSHTNDVTRRTVPSEKNGTICFKYIFWTDEDWSTPDDIFFWQINKIFIHGFKFFSWSYFLSVESSDVRIEIVTEQLFAVKNALKMISLNPLFKQVPSQGFPLIEHRQISRSDNVNYNWKIKLDSQYQINTFINPTNFKEKEATAKVLRPKRDSSGSLKIWSFCFFRTELCMQATSDRIFIELWMFWMYSHFPMNFASTDYGYNDSTHFKSNGDLFNGNSALEWTCWNSLL